MFALSLRLQEGSAGKSVGRGSSWSGSPGIPPCSEGTAGRCCTGALLGAKIQDRQEPGCRDGAEPFAELGCGES